MHYRNGREAKNGDKVVMFPGNGAPVVGILYDAVAGNDTCNGRIAPTSPNDPWPNLREVLHADDVKAASFDQVVAAEQQARLASTEPAFAAADPAPAPAPEPPPAQPAS